MPVALYARRFVIPVLLCCITTSCGLFDSGVEWRHGSYALLWIDDPNEVRLSYDMGEGSWEGQIDTRVFAVGANERHIVAKQHPKGDKRTTNYYIVDLQIDPRNGTAVIGPLTAEGFAEKSRELQLPGFTKTLESLL